jgi:hypothetical protein
MPDNVHTLDLAPPPQSSVPATAPPEPGWLDLPRTDLTTLRAGTITPGGTVTCDVFVTIDWAKDEVIITSALLGQDGRGRTFDEALESLLRSAWNKRVDLESREATLSSADRQTLDLLRSTIDASPRYCHLDMVRYRQVMSPESYAFFINFIGADPLGFIAEDLDDMDDDE